MSKLLFLDTETAPHTAYVWGLFKETVPIQRLIETGRVMCFSAKWRDEDNIRFFSEHHDGHEQVIHYAHDLLSEADVVIHYNGESFDIPM